MKPMRVGLRQTSSTTRSEPGVTQAPTTKKAAADGSPGTARSIGGRARRRPARPARRRGCARGSHPSPAGAARCGPGTGPARSPRWRRSAWRPASSSAVLTWALATASSWRIPASPPPRIDSGASRPPSRPSIRAPISRSGSTTRPMGRRAIEESPVSTVWNGRPARIPASSRIEVPELPQSMTASGSISPSKPGAPDDHDRPDRLAGDTLPHGTAPSRTLTPSASTAARAGRHVVAVGQPPSAGWCPGPGRRRAAPGGRWTCRPAPAAAPAAAGGRPATARRQLRRVDGRHPSSRRVVW